MWESLLSPPFLCKQRLLQRAKSIWGTGMAEGDRARRGRRKRRQVSTDSSGKGKIGGCGVKWQSKAYRLKVQDSCIVFHFPSFVHYLGNRRVGKQGAALSRSSNCKKATVSISRYKPWNKASTTCPPGRL